MFSHENFLLNGTVCVVTAYSESVMHSSVFIVCRSYTDATCEDSVCNIRDSHW